MQGTLHMLILKTLTLEPMHGYGIGVRLEQISRGVFQVNPGTFFPALYRLEDGGFVKGEWGRSENNRRARFYAIAAAGRRQLANEKAQWHRMSSIIEALFEGER